MGEMTLQVYEQHLGNPHERVRKEIAEHIDWLSRDAVQRV